jgi:hypothetical protein
LADSEGSPVCDVCRRGPRARFAGKRRQCLVRAVAKLPPSLPRQAAPLHMLHTFISINRHTHPADFLVACFETRTACIGAITMADGRSS